MRQKKLRELSTKTTKIEGLQIPRPTRKVSLLDDISQTISEGFFMIKNKDIRTSSDSTPEGREGQFCRRLPYDWSSVEGSMNVMKITQQKGLCATLSMNWFHRDSNGTCQGILQTDPLYFSRTGTQMSDRMHNKTLTGST